MPRYFFDVKNGHRLFDSAGFVCDGDTDAIIRATVLAIGVSLDKPEDDPERRISIINDAGHEIGTVPVYSKPSVEHPAHLSGDVALRWRLQLTVKLPCVTCGRPMKLTLIEPSGPNVELRTFECIACDAGASFLMAI